jgi:hypothetical protein
MDNNNFNNDINNIKSSNNNIQKDYTTINTTINTINRPNSNSNNETNSNSNNEDDNKENKNIYIKTIEEKYNEEKYNVKKISKKNNNKRSYKKHIVSINENDSELDIPCFDIIDNIKIYDGTTNRIRIDYNKKIKYLKSTLNNKLILSNLKTSTLTVKGKMSNILFDEKILIKQLSIPTGYINKIKSKYGTLINPEYKEQEPPKPSTRGRKPDKKKEKKFFNTQITFYIAKEPKNIYIIKLFRNGVFQVSGIKFKTMSDLIPIANILKEYLILNIKKDIQIIEFKAVMRNYKCHIKNSNSLISLKKMENLLKQEKQNANYNYIIDALIQDNIKSETYNLLKEYISGYNLMNIAEITYISGKSLNIKLYRHKPDHLEKKITIKIYIKGKINFDGFNSQIEVEEAYYWLNYIFKKYENIILIDKNSIKNEAEEDTDKESIYDDNIDIDENTDEYKIIPVVPIDRKKLFLSELNNKANNIFNSFR